MTAHKKIELSFSDVDFGCIEYGFIPRRARRGETLDDYEAEDAMYARHVNRQSPQSMARVVEGTLYVKAS